MKLLIKSGSRCFPQKTRYHPTACNQNVLCPTSRPGCSSMLPRATPPKRRSAWKESRGSMSRYSLRRSLRFF